MSPDPNAANVSPAEFGKIATTVIGIITFLWAVFYRIARPFVDEQRFQSWVRKSTEVERHMRENMFEQDIIDRRRVKRLAVRTMRQAESNTAAIGRLIETQQAATILLSSIPHLAASMENMSTALEKMNKSLDLTNDIARDNGERISAHAALLGLEQDRRHMVRRTSDPLPEGR